MTVAAPPRGSCSRRSPTMGDLAQSGPFHRKERAALDAALIEANARDDRATLVALYSEAADRHEAVRDVDAACFFLTQAYVFALEAGVAEADLLHDKLVAHGREE